MKKTLLMLAAALLSMTVVAQQYEIDTDKLSQYDQNKPFGFGADITGGEGGEVVVVTNSSQFRSHMGISNSTYRSTKKIIYLSGTISMSGIGASNIKNKTVIGLPGSALVNNQDPTKESSTTGILSLSNCSNIIFRNVTFKSQGAYDRDGNDNLALSTCSNIWIDHCDFQDGVDGNFDCTNASDNICVTWCRFRYLLDPHPGGSGGSDDHRFSNLWGGGDKAEDSGKLNTTFANCWWDEGCKQRMPRVRFGKVHLLNCLYSSTIADYCIGAGYRSNIYVENCAFTSDAAKKTPWACYATSGSYTDYNIQLVGNQGAANETSKKGSITQFVPTYEYAKYDASLVEATVSNTTNGAGATLTVKDATAISTVMTQSAPLSTTYYDLKGQQVGADAKGMVIVKQHMSDGTVQTRKVVR